MILWINFKYLLCLILYGDNLSFVRIKTIQGKKYKYIVRGFRNGKDVKQVVVKYLGPVDPIYKISKRKSNAWLFARKLKDGEEKELKKMKYSNSIFTRDRSRIILLSSKGAGCKAIAEKVGCYEIKVRSAIKSFNKEGMSCLTRKKRKYTAKKMNPTAVGKILQIASTDPVKLNQPFSTWSLSKLKSYIMKEGIVDYVSRPTLMKVLKQNKMKLKKSKKFQYSNDPNFF